MSFQTPLKFPVKEVSVGDAWLKPFPVRDVGQSSGDPDVRWTVTSRQRVGTGI